MCADMGQTFNIGDKQYNVDELSVEGMRQFEALKFVTQRMEELQKNKALLQRAKNSYFNSLKNEILSDKAGLLIEDN
jgi:hypothetical protein